MKQILIMLFLTAGAWLADGTPALVLAVGALVIFALNGSGPNPPRSA